MLDIDKEDYEKAGSKFITLPFDLSNYASAKGHVGEIYLRNIECGMLDWDTPGKSMKIPVVITEGVDNGKDDKLSFGVDSKGIWKGKQIYKAITGEDMPFKKGKDGKEHPVINPEKINGKEAVAVYAIQEGLKGGKEGGDKIVYPKLNDIQPKGYTVKASNDVGI